ncbi:DJ-1 family glyoxalase III [Microbulbifer sediminum]|uniref:DJ-1 family glyoxalase III n=1 Tax=Microbulbifer sediminum TaxID=2904250 RepID=UPI001F2BE06B|nr:DJ-1 family glyoxalase III [Microbulbifer sediminum]
MTEQQKRVLLPVADGSEEIEAVTIIDVLRRAGAQVTVASVMASETITASRGVVITADCRLAECEPRRWDLVVLPGGMPGAAHLAADRQLMEIVRKQLRDGGWLGAICAAPAVVLGRHGLLAEREATCHESFREELRAQALVARGEKVVRDRNLVTSQAPGTAMAFALELVACLYSEKQRQTVATPMAVGPPGV